VSDCADGHYSGAMIEPTEVFSAEGLLARELPGFTHREAQATMAELVWAAIGSGRHLAVEAGTGIGKTFAYLVPVLLAGRRAVISTGTKTLQDQLFGRDLPALGAAIGRPVSVALLKGRANYLCWHRLALAQSGDLGFAMQLPGLGGIERWARASASGDLNEIDDSGEGGQLVRWLTSTVDNCLGSQCEWIDECFVAEARRSAQAADVVVVNHHLLLADLALKEAGFGELLPGVELVVVDEAHLLPEIAQQFFGVSVGTRELDGLGNDLVAEARAVGLAESLQPPLEALASAAAAARSASARLDGRTPWIAAGAELRRAIESWREPIAALIEALEPARSASAGIGRAYERSVDLDARLAALSADDARGLRWVEPSQRGIAAHWTPIDTGEALGERIASHGGTWLLTSATLAVGDDFGHFLDRVGLPDADTAVLASPFDYESNARIYVPEGMPNPSEPDYVASLLADVMPLIEAAGGGVFLLFTSYRALGEAEAWLAGRSLPGPLLVQGRAARTDLLERFRDDGRAVLLGTSSFWQGVDVRGDALRLVVIDKLPFASPGDPLIRARLDHIRAQGGDPFNEFQLPQAVLTLKQGVGRLIRDFDDRGLIVIGDPRLRTRGYGRVFLESLPPMPVLESAEAALAFAQTLVLPPAEDTDSAIAGTRA